jgi:hypothetical protein
LEVALEKLRREIVIDRCRARTGRVAQLIDQRIGGSMLEVPLLAIARRQLGRPRPSAADRVLLAALSRAL